MTLLKVGRSSMVRPAVGKSSQGVAASTLLSAALIAEASSALAASVRPEHLNVLMSEAGENGFARVMAYSKAPVSTLAMGRTSQGHLTLLDSKLRLRQQI